MRPLDNLKAHTRKLVNSGEMAHRCLRATSTEKLRSTKKRVLVKTKEKKLWIIKEKEREKDESSEEC